MRPSGVVRQLWKFATIRCISGFLRTGFSGVGVGAGTHRASPRSAPVPATDRAKSSAGAWALRRVSPCGPGTIARMYRRSLKVATGVVCPQGVENGWKPTDLPMVSFDRWPFVGPWGYRRISTKVGDRGNSETQPFRRPTGTFRNVHDSIKDAGEAIRRGAAALEVDGRPLQQGIFQYGIHGCRHRLG